MTDEFSREQIAAGADELRRNAGLLDDPYEGQEAPGEGALITVTVLDRTGGPDGDDPQWVDDWTGRLLRCEPWGLWWWCDEEQKVILTPWRYITEITTRHA